MQSELFSPTFFLLLMLHIGADHLGIQADGIHAIPRRPEMITPIGLLLQIRKLLEHPDGCAPFHGAQQVGDRDLGGHHHNQVNVLFLNIQFHYLTP